MLGRLGWRVLGAAGRIHPVAWFAIEWVAIALVAHFGHLYAGDQRFQLGLGNAILAGFGLSSLTMLTWWITARHK